MVIFEVWEVSIFILGAAIYRKIKDQPQHERQR